MSSSSTSKQKINPGHENIALSHNQIKQLIGVTSSKGGVGKSLVTGLLAIELARKNYQVGILDANPTGSSISMLFGLSGPVKPGQYSFLPIQSHSGIKIISLDLLLDNREQSVIWKDSLLVKVIEELWREVEWGALDYLLVDLPPATSEVTVATMQSLPFKGLVIVTMPQELTTRIVSKAIYTIQKIDVPIIGIVENMAHYLNPETGQKQYIFGQCHGEGVANAAKAPMLSQLPLDPMVAKLCDSGNIEDVILEESSELIGSFLESLTSLDEKEASLLAGSPNSDNEDASFGEHELSEEDANDDLFSSPSNDSTCEPFSETVIHFIRTKENMGCLDHPDAQGHFLGRCGDRMQIDLHIIDGRIIEARYLADGCGATLACGSMITKMACPRTLDQAGQITPEDLFTALGGLPDDHVHCAELAVMTLKEALIDAVEGRGKILSSNGNARAG